MNKTIEELQTDVCQAALLVRQTHEQWKAAKKSHAKAWVALQEAESLAVAQAHHTAFEAPGNCRA